MEIWEAARPPADILGVQVDRLVNLVRQAKASPSADRAKSKEALRHAAQSFEALFYSMLIKQLRQSSQELGEGFFAGDEADIFGGLFDYYLGQFLAQRQRLGIGALIEQQYKRWQSATNSQQTPGPSEAQRIES